jgi:ferredoxin-NADP reductase
MRVLTEGHICAGDPIIKTRTGPGALSVADVDALLYLPGRHVAKLRLALQVPALSDGWRQSFRELLANEDHASASRTTATTQPAWSGFRQLRVSKVVRETATVSSFYLADPADGVLPSAAAGQYLTVRLVGDPAPVRSYSLSSAPDTGSYRISVKREPHGVASNYLDRRLRSGGTLEVAAPRGEFVLDADVRPVLLISAGIGVTPVLSMLHALAAQGSERDVWWVHAARRPQEHAFASEARTLLESLRNAHEYVFYSAATPAECRRAHATRGRVTRDALRRLACPSDASAYVCGPASFMVDVENALTDLGVERARIHTERFGALPSITPGLTERRRTPHAPPGPPGTGPLVTFARTGISARFRTDEKSVLELADACDISTRWSCRSGVCHTCVTPLVSGDISYDPAPLELPADGEVLICCAQPRSDIVVDM